MTLLSPAQAVVSLPLTDHSPACEPDGLASFFQSRGETH
jgi:hypothetical protein